MSGRIVRTRVVIANTRFVCLVKMNIQWKLSCREKRQEYNSRVHLDNVWIVNFGCGIQTVDYGQPNGPFLIIA